MNRRLFLRGLFATPAVVAASSLMPVRGIVMPVSPMVFDGEDITWTATADNRAPIRYAVIYQDTMGFADEIEVGGEDVNPMRLMLRPSDYTIEPNGTIRIQLS